MKQLTIICPALNEIKFIEQVIHDLCVADGLDKEVLIVDGGSTDGTQMKVKSLMATYSNLKLVNNPRKTSTAAFNIGVTESQSTYVAFVGAHARYSNGYFANAIKELNTNSCDAVGGPLQQEGKSLVGKGIAVAMQSKAGVGNTEFRTSSERKYVDSVAFAIYRRSMIVEAGLMDESLPVNQDDEFHYRLNALGYKILMIPEISSVYYVRDSYVGLFKQYLKYGLYKPAVLRKVKGSVKLRHLIPAFFCLYLISLPIGWYFNFWLLFLYIYLLLIAVAAFISKEKLLVKLVAIPAFVILHLSYGLGFIIGLIKSKNA
jgi:glycosyltransferase involved in cell wall biosynthesis